MKRTTRFHLEVNHEDHATRMSESIPLKKRKGYGPLESAPLPRRKLAAYSDFRPNSIAMGPSSFQVEIFPPVASPPEVTAIAIMVLPANCFS